MYFLLAINQCFHDENEIVFRKVRTKSTEIPLIYVLALSSAITFMLLTCIVHILCSLYIMGYTSAICILARLVHMINPKLNGYIQSSEPN